jgi:hypothetical protein
VFKSLKRFFIERNSFCKQQIIDEIKERLSALGLPAQYGNGADITVNAELLEIYSDYLK